LVEVGLIGGGHAAAVLPDDEPLEEEPLDEEPLEEELLESEPLEEELLEEEPLEDELLESEPLEEELLESEPFDDGSPEEPAPHAESSTRVPTATKPEGTVRRHTGLEEYFVMLIGFCKDLRRGHRLRPSEKKA
jgi:hypothetical protein